jgi:hypothetical protein
MLTGRQATRRAKVNWEAVGAIGEVLGAAAVVVTLGYLAVQVRHAKNATADQSRIYRATAVREMILETCRDDTLRKLQTKSWGMESYYQAMADELGLPLEDATKLDWGNGYYFWMWWGQYASTIHRRDRRELEHIIATLGGTPGMRAHWEKSPLTRPLLDRRYVRFVDGILARTEPTA